MTPTYPVPHDNAVGSVPDRGQFRFAHKPAPLQEPARNAVVPAVAAAPVTRPRGRLLIALLMLMACSAGVFTVWDSLLRYQAYGVVTGRIIDVGVPIDGVLQSVSVSEGDLVREDTRLAKVVDIEIEQQLARISDELKVAEAQLQAEIARVQWQSHVEETEMTRSIAELFESASRMHDETGALELLQYQLSFNRDLHARNATARVEMDSYEIQARAKKEELDSIQKAIEVLKDRAQKAVDSPRLGAEQIQPLIAKSEMLLNEILRLREKINLGEIRSPVNGTVLRRHHPAGECIRSHEPLFSVMEESSLEVEVFLPQSVSRKYSVGEILKLRIEPYEELVPCKVVAIGTEHRRPPEHIEIFYRSNVRLLPIRLKPLGEFADARKLSPGAVAKLPHAGLVL